ADEAAADEESDAKAVAEEAADHALDAAHWFDQAGHGSTGGAQARSVLAKAYAAADRSAEAAEILQSALPDLVELDEGLGVQARELLGDLLRGLYDLRGAAEQFLLAAETTKGWDDPRPQAHFAHAAAEVLGQAGRTDEAEAAYSRALELWRQAGDNPVGEVRVLRSLAWLRLRTDDYDIPTAAGVARARSLMNEAVSVLEDADEPQLRYELAQTWEQLGEILYDYDDEEAYDSEDEDVAPDPAEVRREAISLFDRAAALYVTLGEGALQNRVTCVTRAAWLERQLELPDAATARLTALTEELGALQDDEYAQRTAQRLESTLKHWSTND
ncbi:tetratricopeptide repeat protein, partial [Streptomyces sp. T-3]|nr:tetratricopeptide repeat protein [Streptomyces sp. T-3]